MSGLLPPPDRRGSLLLGVYAAVSLLLLSTGDRVPTSALRGVGAWIFAPLDRSVLFVDRMAAAWRESSDLHGRVARLTIENQRLRVAGVENDSLRRVLGLPSVHSGQLRPVEVLALSGDPVPTAATLSAGTRRHVDVGDAVVTGDGLLGRIGESWPDHSRVVLLTDANSAVACEIESTAVLGIVHPVHEPRPRLMLTGVPLSDTVRAGQRVLTSGLSRRYPRGLLVGTVARTRRDATGLTQEIEVEPAARLSRLRHAFVVDAPGDLPGAAAGPR
jgi:rod shape-determining protein MreC